MNIVDQNQPEIDLANEEGRAFYASAQGQLALAVAEAAAVAREAEKRAEMQAMCAKLTSEGSDFIAGMLLEEYHRERAAANAAQDAANDLADAFATLGDDLADAYANRAPQAPGMYAFGGVTYAVVPTKDGKNLYAKRLILGGKKPTYAYAPGMMAVLKESMKMTIAEGTVLSGQIGACCVCTRTLTVAKSVAAGIGPKCAKMFG